MAIRLARRKEIYLDNASTSYPKPEAVYQAVDRFARECGASPGRGGYRRALDAGEAISKCRSVAAAMLGVSHADRIAFSSNSTEALNWAIKGILREGDHVVVTALEHNAVLRPVRALEKAIGVEWSVVLASSAGEVDPGEVAAAIRPKTRLICAVHASNVLGNILPIKEIARASHERSALLLVDGSQSAGALQFSVEEMCVDLFAFTGHKSLLGPPGTGGLYVRPGLQIKPWKEGGTGTRSESLDHPENMPESLEAGTPNSWGLAGLLAGIESIQRMGGVHWVHRHESRLAARLLEGLKNIDQVVVYGPQADAARVGIVSMNIGPLPPEDVGRILSQRYGIAVRAGLHCSPLAHEAAGTARRGGSVRFGIGPYSTEGEIDAALEAVGEIASSLYRNKAAGRSVS